MIDNDNSNWKRYFKIIVLVWSCSNNPPKSYQFQRGGGFFFFFNLLQYIVVNIAMYQLLFWRRWASFFYDSLYFAFNCLYKLTNIARRHTMLITPVLVRSIKFNAITILLRVDCNTYWQNVSTNNSYFSFFLNMFYSNRLMLK